MFMNSSILALVLGGITTLLLLIYGAYFGLKIALQWNPESATEEQLELEKRTYLVSTIVNYVLLFEILSLILFIYTVDDIHEIIPGAMCATGSLNANRFGFPTLLVKLFTFFLYGSWIVLNHIDRKAEDTPLIKTKYLFLLGIIPFAVLENTLMIAYFAKIDPETLVSCCGVVFNPGGKVTSVLSPLPKGEMMGIFFGGFLFLLLLGLAMYWRGGRLIAYLFSASSMAFLIISISSIISFISGYIYQMPTHPCPFDFFQREYHYVGYPLYISLFGGALFGLAVGIVEPFETKYRSLTKVIRDFQKKAVLLSMAGFSVFTSISVWYIMRFILL